MKSIRLRLSVAVCVILSIITINSGCRHKLKTTSVVIEEYSNYHGPVLEGESVNLKYKITNTGKEHLIISEIQTTCGCISTEIERKRIPAGRSEILQFKFDTSNIIGKVEHEILLFGNFDTTSVYRLKFDTFVVKE